MTDEELDGGGASEIPLVRYPCLRELLSSVEMVKRHLERRLEELERKAEDNPAEDERYRRIREEIFKAIVLLYKKELPPELNDLPLDLNHLNPEQQRTVDAVRRRFGDKLPEGMHWTEGLEAFFSRLFEEYNRDKKTGLLSQDFLEDSLKKIIDMRRERLGIGEDVNPVTVVVCDLNQFKSFNTNMGYRLTDQLLISITNQLRRNANEWDFEEHLPLARLNSAGDEFCFIMHCSEDEAARRMEKLNTLLHNTTFDFVDKDGGKHFTVRGATMSYGCHELDSDLNKVGARDTVDSALLKAAGKMQEFKEEFPEYAREIAMSPTPKLTNHDDAGKAIDFQRQDVSSWTLLSRTLVPRAERVRERQKLPNASGWIAP